MHRVSGCNSSKRMLCVVINNSCKRCSLTRVKFIRFVVVHIVIINVTVIIRTVQFNPGNFGFAISVCRLRERGRMSKSVYVRVFHDLKLLRYVLHCAIQRQL